MGKKIVEEVRAQVAFRASVSGEPAALDEMIRMATKNESGHVRGQAIFWLGKKPGNARWARSTARLKTIRNGSEKQRCFA